MQFISYSLSRDLATDEELDFFNINNAGSMNGDQEFMDGNMSACATEVMVAADKAREKVCAFSESLLC